MITIKELQGFLNKYEVLRGIQVGYTSDERRVIAPQVVTLSGMVNVQGTPHLFEAELNLNEFSTRADLMLLGKRILQAFEKAGVEQL